MLESDNPDTFQNCAPSNVKDLADLLLLIDQLKYEQQQIYVKIDKMCNLQVKCATRGRCCEFRAKLIKLYLGNLKL